MKLLIVEDESIVALSMQDTLSDAGHEVLPLARDRASALESIAGAKPDLALVDLNLGGESGAMVALLLKERFGIPSIFVSANPAECHDVGFDIGVVGCLSKPFRPEELLESLDAATAVMRRETPRRLPRNLAIYFSH